MEHSPTLAQARGSALPSAVTPANQLHRDENRGEAEGRCRKPVSASGQLDDPKHQHENGRVRGTIATTGAGEADGSVGAVG